MVLDADDHTRFKFFSFQFHFPPLHAIFVLFCIHSNDWTLGLDIQCENYFSSVNKYDPTSLFIPSNLL